jgi:hypothetical protein
VPTRPSPPALLVRDAFRDGATGCTRTRATLTSWAPARSAALRRARRGEGAGVTGEPPPVCGPLVAVLVARTPLAERLGRLQGLGSERWATRVLVRLVARVAAPGSRLAAVRWATPHAVAETRGLTPCEADDLDAARARVAAAQADRADAREHRTVRQPGGTPTGVVSAVTAASLAGAHQARAAFG